MTLTRRKVFLHGGVFGAGVIASNLPGLEAMAAGTPPKRVSLQGLAWNDPIVSTYRDAVGMMKAMPSSQQFSWVNLAKIHGFNPNAYHYCPHGNWYFLPWHRAFTAMYERVVRKLMKNDGFAMPYWDWTENPVMPEVFTMKTTPDGKPNPLNVSDAGWTRTWPANKPMPAENVGPDVLKKILEPTEYELFGTSRPEGQNSHAPKWITDGSGTQDELEGNAHNNVHNNIGGWMPTASSPRDPIFFMHHCNIDRIWAVWNQHNGNSGDSLWTDMPFTNNFYDAQTGGFWSPKVSDLYVPEDLGYTYDLGPQLLVSAAPNVVTLRNKLTTLFAAPNLTAAKASGVTTVVAANTGTAKPGQPLAVALTVPAEALKAIGGRAAAPAIGAVPLLAERNQAAAGTHALAFIRDVVVTDARSTMFRVFIDLDNLTADTPITDPHYVGTFAVFHHGAPGAGMAHAAHAAPSFAVDLTGAIQRVYGGGKPVPAQIKVQILPVSTGSDLPANGTATPASVEVAFVST